MNKWYLGINGQARKVFKAAMTPTQESHGEQFNTVVGPFRTKRGAMFTAAFGHNNPHIRTTADAERISRKYA